MYSSPEIVPLVPAHDPWPVQLARRAEVGDLPRTRPDGRRRLRRGVSERKADHVGGAGCRRKDRRRHYPAGRSAGALTAAANCRCGLLGCQPGVAANQDQFPPGGRRGQMRFNRRPIRFRQSSDDFRNASALPGSSKAESTFDCTRLRHRRLLAQQGADANVAFHPLRRLIRKDCDDSRTDRWSVP